MEIENLEKVLWKFEGFVEKLKIQNLSKYLQLCHNLKYDSEFRDVCHRAKREIEQLVINDKKSIIKVYFIKFQHHFNELNSWRVKKLKDERNFNQVNISILQIHDVFDNLKLHYSELFPYQIDSQENTPEPHRGERKPEEKLSNFITHESSEDIVKEIIVKYKNIKGKELRRLLKALKELELFPKRNKDALFHRCCKNDFNWDIGKYQAMEEKTFTKGYTDNHGIHIQSEDEKDLKSKIEYLESIIKTN